MARKYTTRSKEEKLSIVKKSDFVNLIIGIIGGVSLLLLSIVAWLRSGRKIKTNREIAGKVLYGVFASLVLGAGMCMIMVWKSMLPGILAGIVGIVLLLMLVPMCIGLK